MELFDYVLLVLITGTFFYAYFTEKDVITLRQELRELSHVYKDLKRCHDNLEHRYMYDTLLPKIQEYADLKGYFFERNCDNVRFFKDGYFAENLHLNQISSRLAELKSVLEKNCPKKCKKAAKKS